ncbi:MULTISPECIES: YciI family protein [unclassified Rhodococcus (in: high G+C Gram-positive bacteria)]|uniref:YciI family protein n=1 Tax=unclassified Rhodococcus (in: high G+C Gram-positive bacteria) TaxID=192944 RepID=UPI00146E797C|nr:MULTISPECIES: YciI family protein [unclassified Rhodococcus (in: high G+C Gram-positive bacteria)]NMD96568.1 hypothetical protein [Rhodococcus sp. BL-253-APC-6A1W]NME79294.1 hypothetical protein [Rhodococcus sp. 105337]
MKYMLLIYTSAADESTCTVEDWQDYEKAMRDAGVLVTGHALQDLTTATAVQVAADGRRTVTDGPYAETREVLGGYDVVDVPDLDVAIEWASRCPGARDGGTVVVRPIAEFGD